MLAVLEPALRGEAHAWSVVVPLSPAPVTVPGTVSSTASACAIRGTGSRARARRRRCSHGQCPRGRRSPHSQRLQIPESGGIRFWLRKFKKSWKFRKSWKFKKSWKFRKSWKSRNSWKFRKSRNSGGSKIPDLEIPGNENSKYGNSRKLQIWKFQETSNMENRSLKIPLRAA